MKKYIFVYGTLKKGHGNNGYLGDSKLIGPAKTAPKYTLFDGGFPIVERGGETSIIGEVYEVTDPEALADVYALEGYKGTPGSPDNWYDVDVVTLDNGIEAEMFVMNAGESRRHNVVASGEWR